MSKATTMRAAALVLAVCVFGASATCYNGYTAASNFHPKCTQYNDQTTPPLSCCTTAQSDAAAQRIDDFTATWRDRDTSCCYENLIDLSCNMACHLEQEDFAQAPTATTAVVKVNLATAQAIYDVCKDVCTDTDSGTVVKDQYADVTAFFAGLSAATIGTPSIEDPAVTFNLTSGTENEALEKSPESTKYDLTVLSACGADSRGCVPFPKNEPIPSTAVRDWLIIGFGSVALFAGIFVLSTKLGNKIFSQDEADESLTKKA